MKITENQLRKAIRKEKSKMSEGRVGKRALAMHTPIETRSALEYQVENFLEIVMADAADELGDDEGGEFAELALLEVVAGPADTLGYLTLARELRAIETKRYSHY